MTPYTHCDTSGSQCTLEHKDLVSPALTPGHGSGCRYRSWRAQGGASFSMGIGRHGCPRLGWHGELTHKAMLTSLRRPLGGAGDASRAACLAHIGKTIVQERPYFSQSAL
jgi:hypothetical protein